MSEETVAVSANTVDTPESMTDTPEPLTTAKRQATPKQLASLQKARAARAEKQRLRKLAETIEVVDEDSSDEFEHVLIRRRKKKPESNPIHTNPVPMAPTPKVATTPQVESSDDEESVPVPKHTSMEKPREANSSTFIFV